MRAILQAARRAPLLISIGVAALHTAHAQIMVVGIDRKFTYDQNAVRQTLDPGRDEVLFFDVEDVLKPRLVGSIALENSILGPPTNVTVTPHGLESRAGR